MYKRQQWVDRSNVGWSIIISQVLHIVRKQLMSVCTTNIGMNVIVWLVAVFNQEVLFYMYPYLLKNYSSASIANT